MEANARVSFDILISIEGFEFAVHTETGSIFLLLDGRKRVVYLGNNEKTTIFETNVNGEPRAWAVGEAELLCSSLPLTSIKLSEFSVSQSPAKVLAEYPSLDREYAMTRPLDLPLILAMLNKEEAVLIDGWHRLYKAVALGVESLPAYVLPLAESVYSEIPFPVVELIRSMT